MNYIYVERAAKIQLGEDFFRKITRKAEPRRERGEQGLSSGVGRNQKS